MFETVREKLAQLIAPKKPKPLVKSKTIRKKAVPARAIPMNSAMMSRMYAAAKQSRLTTGWGNATTSEDYELSQSLVRMRDRSREACRDSSYAKRAKVIVQNNVVGAGIGLQARIQTTRGTLKQPLNEAIEEAWEQWSEPTNSHMGGSLHFSELERQCMGQIFEAGEVLIRKHYQKLGDSLIPLALEIVEAERLAEDFQGIAGINKPNTRLGVEVDEYQRPLAYWIRTAHPNELRFRNDRTANVERVSASEILHLRIIDRWPQTRGVPWMHAALRRINDMDGLGEAEIVAARAAACYMGFIELPTAEVKYGEKQTDGTTMEELTPAVIQRLNAGEKFTFAAPNRPNSQLDPFMRLMLREVASGVGASYESLSRDYSQSNYSSSRLALLDDRDLWRTLQRWFIRSFRRPLYKEWLRLAVMAGAIEGITVEDYAVEPARFEEVRFKPRGWNWVDPTKEVAAYKDAIRCGFTTVSRVIEQTGNGDDLEDILTEREEELKWMHDKGLIFDTDPSVSPTGGPVAKQPAQSEPAGTQTEMPMNIPAADAEGSEEEAKLFANGFSHKLKSRLLYSSERMDF